MRRLDEFGIDYIEGGFPASNPKDVAFFREVAVMDLKHAQIAAFGSTCKKGVAAAEDPGLADLIACGAPVDVYKRQDLVDLNVTHKKGLEDAWISIA